MAEPKKTQKGHYNDAKDEVEENVNQGGAVVPPVQQEAPIQPVGPTKPIEGVNPPADGQFKGKTYDDVMGFIEERKKALDLETDEQRKKRERMERSQGIINGISDLGRAVANMYYTTKYAPNGYDPKQSLTTQQQARMERQRKERKEKEDQYLNYLLTQKKLLDGEKATNLTERKIALQEKDDARKESLNDAKVKAYDAMTKYREAIATKNDALAEKYKAEAEFYNTKEYYLGLGYDDKHAESMARIALSNARKNKIENESGDKVVTTENTYDRLGNKTGSTTTTSHGSGNSGGSGSNTKKANPMGGNKKKSNPMK